MSKKNHDRSPDKKGFSVALPRDLLAKIEEIAKEEHRSRNGQIEYFLDRSVKKWKADRTGSTAQSNPVESPDFGAAGNVSAGISSPGEPNGKSA